MWPSLHPIHGTQDGDISRYWAATTPKRTPDPGCESPAVTKVGECKGRVWCFGVDGTELHRMEK